MRSPWAGYGAKEVMPLGGYSAILGAFALTFGPALYRARGQRLARLGLADLLRVGIATHKLTRIITRDWVTAPLRAPFTEYVESQGGGEVTERSRGHGLRRAVGDLLTCPFCTGPWVAGALVAGSLAAPPLARTITTTLTAVAISDWLHRAYELLAARSRRAASKADRARG